MKQNINFTIIKPIKENILSLTLQTGTICVLFQCAWILYVFIYLVKLLVEGPKSPCLRPDDDECHVASFANHVMEQVVKISVPLFFFIPPLLPALSSLTIVSIVWLDKKVSFMLDVLQRK